MRILLAGPQFRLLWTANLTATLAGWWLGMALSVHVFQVTGSPLATGALFAAGLGPAIVVGSLAGAVADRFDRVRLLRVLSWVRVAVVAAAAVFGDNVPVLFCLALAQSVAMQFFVPAEQAMVAALVPAVDLPAASAANSVATNGTRLVGPVLGGTLMAVLGFGPTVAVTAGLLVITAVLLTRLRRTAPAPHDSRIGFVQAWRGGVAELFARPPTRAVAILQVLDGAKEGALTPLLPVLMLGVINSSPAWMGAVNSSFALTAIVAAPLVPALIRRFGYRQPIACGASLCGLLLLALALHPTELTALASFLLSGFPFTVSWVAANTLLLVASNESSRATAVGSVNSLYAATCLAAVVAASVGAEMCGPIPVLVVAAVIQAAAGPAFLLVCGSVEAHHPDEPPARPALRS